jgi:pterin-4a-carbinolamine dehydratase
MTTFTDREHALEAHYAAQLLAMFREQFAAAKQFGFRIAAHLGVDEAETELFAIKFAERSVVERADMSEYADAIAALMQMDAEAAERAAHHPDTEPATPYANRPWVEFVAGQMLLLFGSAKAEAPVTVGTH